MERREMRYFEKCFHTVIIAGLIGLIAGAASADTSSFITEGKIIRKEPIYTQVQQRDPYQECYTVDVPVYGNVGGGNGASAGDVLGGMIIGGLIGKGATGKDNGAAAGAVIGGLIAADRGQQGQQGIVGYKQENRCETKYRVSYNQVVNQYKLTFRVDGHDIVFTVNRAQGENALIGQTKRIRVNYQFLN